ncbi:MAG: metallophosphoesterase family protein [Polyangiales bacterium]
MARFVHSADWQMGMRAAHAGASADSVRRARIDAAERVAAAARARAVDFVVLCGDTFEDNQVERSLVAQTVEIMASCRCPVYVIPGNHDALVAGSVWSDGSFARAPTVRVLRDESPVETQAGVTLWPCVARARHDERDPTAWVRVPNDDRVHVVLAHGTVESVHYEEPWYPIARDCADRTGADYVALGHFHAYVGYPSADGVVRMAYSGTHEPTRFGERDPGQALLVEVDRRGAAPSIERIVTGALRWLVLEASLQEQGDVGRVRAQVEALAEGRAHQSLLRLKLDGYLRVDEQEALVALAEHVRTAFLFGRVEATLRPAPTDAAWTRSLPVGPVLDCAQRLARWAEPSCADRPSDVSADVAARALLELYALASAGD